jgi:hypothetical protein
VRRHVNGVLVDTAPAAGTILVAAQPFRSGGHAVPDVVHR